MKNHRTTYSFVLTFIAIATLSACGGYSLQARQETAEGIAASGGMRAQVIPAGVFNLSIWTHLQKPGAPARIYIEGDGLAWISTYEVSPNPTPRDPFALRLAARDSSENLIYMARPCQFTGLIAGGPCPETYWTSGRTAPEVIAAYQQALDTLKAQNGITAYELVGYSGGGAVVALIAAGRQDVTSLRTVAGNIDYDTFSNLHGTSPLSASLDPARIAAKIATIPQLHFIGGSDTVVPPDIFYSWKKDSGESACLQSMIVPGNTHDKGWVEKWPELLGVPVQCEEKK
jgi:hypothetical protein